MKPFLLEIGVEEIPARFIQPAKEGLTRLMQEALEWARIGHGEISIVATPRRIALLSAMEEGQKESVTIKYGPPRAKAFDAEGKPLPAALGFARSQGVDVSELKIVKKDTAELICVEKVEKGRNVGEVLPDLLKDVISRIPFQKRMRWGSGEFEFARPIQWVVALLGEQIVPFTVAGITSGNRSKGHRFLSSGEVFIREPSQYLDELRKQYVIVSEGERMDMMLKDIRAIEEETGGKALMDDDLMQEILYLTEYPVGLKGRFEEEYLELPRAVLVNVMKGHQRYIPVERQDGRSGLMPAFIFFANTVPKDAAEVIRGNEKVLRARLADGRFFFEEDKKIKLDTLYERLSTVVFHERLGNLKQKTERVREIGLYLSAHLGTGVAEEKVSRASMLIKADLLTHMVGEFPELQGTIGKIYAEHQGEDREVAASIQEHYYPAGVNAALPETNLGLLMALADKMDSLVSFFSVGITPTGNLDPFALRRQAIGIIRIIISKSFHISLASLIEAGYNALGHLAGKLPLETVKETLTEFVATRFRFAMIEEGHNQEFVDSVLPYVSLDIYDGYIRLCALEKQKSIEAFQRLMIGFKRVFNITKSITDTKEVDRTLLAQKEEADLMDLYEANRGPFLSSMENKSYGDALAILVSFKETIDNYFNKVFVMVDDENLKQNRLRLLAKIKDMFLAYGDFSRIRVEEIAHTSA